MTDVPTPSAAVARLLAIAEAGGDVATVEHGADGTAYRFTRHMPDALREAGFDEPAVDYLRSAEEPAEEGFIEADSDTWLFFPVDPAHDLLGDIARNAAREGRRSSKLAWALAAGGVAALLFAAFPGDATARSARLVIAALLLVAAFAARRRI